jgi:hypothetical protein
MGSRASGSTYLVGASVLGSQPCRVELFYQPLLGGRENPWYRKKSVHCAGST